ncbi:MAG: efflux RND transporter periplasmic adaptor subunit [Desulfobacteraceae bacterium]|nr:efflux RND transporter periplasmic adaptor subunit [Desulfobacteraceae bacterium]
MNRRIKRGIVLVAVALGAVLALAFYLSSGKSQSAGFRTVPVQRGDLHATISATGTVEPEEVIDVGAQVAGRILAFGKDRDGKAIDYGSAVEEAMVLAQIDDALFSADVNLYKAQLEQAKAGVARTEADLGQLQAKLVQAERDWNRAKRLGPSEALSKADYDAALSAYEVAKANVAVGRASIQQSKESVAQAKASLSRAQQNLDYCTIRSPVKGVIIDRRVNIGQTVVASLNAPSLFLLAKDLKRMQVWVAVNEADVGSIFPGQAVNFTADAFPGHTFEGEVGKIRLNASMTQNVVNYIVEVVTDNSSGKLLPYLTANVKFLLKSRQNVLYVPNAAVRWVPQSSQIAPDGRGKQPEGAQSEESPEGFAKGTVWVPEGNFVRSVPVLIGTNDGSVTEVQGPGVKEGMQVVIGEQRKDAPEQTQTVSPFTPRLPSRRGSPGPPPN